MSAGDPDMGAVREIAWWDQWNQSHRTEAFVDESDAARTGKMGLAELRSLDLNGPRILEIGCGTGWLAEQLVKDGSYVGMDLSPAAVEVAKRRVPEGEFVAADFHSWSHAGEPFDVILMIDTIAYFRDQEAAVRKTRSLLKRGGILVLTTVNPFVYSRMSWIGPPGEGQVRKWLPRSVLHELLSRNGFCVWRSKTACPAGDRGILRVINSRILDRALSLCVPRSWIRRAKEGLGFGQYRLVVAKAE